MNVGNVIGQVACFYSKHAKVINTIGIGVGVIGTGVLSGKAGIKAHKILEQKRNEQKKVEKSSKKDKHVQEDLSTKEKIKSTWKIWIPTVVCGVSTISLAVLNTCQMNHTIQKLTANVVGLTALCSDKDKLLKKYKAVTKEVLHDDEKIEEIEKKVIKKNAEDAIKNIDENVVCGEGEFICIDALSGRTFSTNIDRIEKVGIMIQKTLMVHDWCALNELYSLLGLEETEFGEEFGWCMYDFDTRSEDFELTVTSAMRNDKPIGVLRYPTPNKMI